MAQRSESRISDAKLVLLAIVGALAAFVIAIVFISGGSIRHVQIFLPEKSEFTVAIRSIDGAIKVVGLQGTAAVNPTILMRTGDFAMEVINQDNAPHTLYIDGLSISTRMLQPGQSEVLTFYSKGEATYNYYIQGNDKPVGQIKAVKVTTYE